MESQAQERVNLFVPVIIIIFIVSIFIVFNYIRGDISVDESLRREIREEIRQEIPELTLAEIEEKILECTVGRTVQQQDWCNLNLARNYRINSCNVIVNQDSKRFCEAIIEEDVQKCDLIFANSVQDGCYITMATIIRDISICRKSGREEFCNSLFS